jgi:hypothetical protein
LGAEVSTKAADLAGYDGQASHGRIDIVIERASVIYIIEVKFNIPPAQALAQIEARNYAERFTQHGKDIILLGLSFMRSPSMFDIEYVDKKLRI